MTSIEETLHSYPRVSLTRLPTPLHPLPHLSTRLGLNIAIKRDDLTDLIFGGDKPRKLEYEWRRLWHMALIPWSRAAVARAIMHA